MASSLPATMRAVVQTAPNQTAIETVPLPKVEYGSALVKLDVTLINANFKNILEAAYELYRLPYPIIPGSFGIGRIVALGPDATTLKEGQLVMVSAFTRARDNPSVHVITGVTTGFSTASQGLYQALSRSGFLAEYVPAPLENIFRLDEARLFGKPESGGLGSSPGELVGLAADSIVYAAMRGIALQAGERVVITPATGHYSSAAVKVAVALGLRVVAASRGAAGLAQLKETFPRSVETVQLTGDVAVDGAALRAFGPVDAVVDVSPPAATGATNLAAALSVLGDRGRVTLVGGRGDETLPIPYATVVLNGLTIKGSYMYWREDVEGVIRLAEAGLLKLGKMAGHVVHGAYSLDEYQAAVDKAAENPGPGALFYIKH